METDRAQKEINVLRRLIAYSEKVFHLSREVVAPISDRRPEPRISTSAVVKSSLVMFWARIGSLNALELTARSRFWKTWLGEQACRADSLGPAAPVLSPGGSGFLPALFRCRPGRCALRPRARVQLSAGSRQTRARRPQSRPPQSLSGCHRSVRGLPSGGGPLRLP